MQIADCGLRIDEASRFDAPACQLTATSLFCAFESRLNPRSAIRNPQYFALAALLCLVTSAALCSEDEDPTEARSSLVHLEKNDQPLDMVAPPSQFVPPDGEELWKRAWQRVTNPPAEEAGGFFDLGTVMGEFVSAKKFHVEFYAPGDNGDELQYVFAADEAVTQGKRVVMTRMQVIWFISEHSMALPKKTPKGKDAPKDVKARPQPPRESALTEAMKGGRIVITAPKAVIDLTTNEGIATGNVTIEIFGKLDPAKKNSDKPFAVLSSERLNWRTWSDPSIGSNELALYTVSEKGSGAEPLVTGRYVMGQADGTETSILIQGRGMVYETGTLDRLNPVYDEDGRTAGLSKVARNRVMFRQDIQLTVTGTTLFAPPVPFSGPMGGSEEGLAETVQVDRKKRKEQPPVAPSRTVISCGGPGLIDLASVPKVQRSASEAPPMQAAPASPTTGLRAIELARKFEFLNGVVIGRGPLEGAEVPPGAEPVTKKHIACKHLRIVYPPGSLPSTVSFPEYAEAIGGVIMNGMMTPPAGPDGPAEPKPFDVRCGRMYFDGPRDNMFLVGSAKDPVSVVSSQLDMRAQQIGYRSRTQTFTAPGPGAKRMVIHAAAMAAPRAQDGEKAEVFNFSAGGDTVVEWNGTMSRELRRLPSPGQADRLKEVLTLKEGVRIEQPQGGLRLMGKVIRLIRALPGGEVEYLSGDGGMDVTMGDLQATGYSVSVDMKYAPSGETIKNVISVTGSRKADLKATLFMGGSAVRADKFVIDRRNDTFRAFGGALAVVKARDSNEPAADKPAAAKDAGALFKGVSFKAGGNLMLQCDGEFSQDGANQTVTIRKNVLVRQPGLQMLADEVVIELDAAKATDESGTPANALFSGDLKSITCNGNVELTTPDQLVQCDQLIHSVKEDTSLLQMNEADNDVRIYAREENGGTRFLSVQKSLKLDGQSGKFTPGGMLLMLPYRSDKPAPRDKYSSPARKKSERKPKPAEKVEEQP